MNGDSEPKQAWWGARIRARVVSIWNLPNTAGSVIDEEVQAVRGDMMDLAREINKEIDQLKDDRDDMRTEVEALVAAAALVQARVKQAEDRVQLLIDGVAQLVKWSEQVKGGGGKGNG